MKEVVATTAGVLLAAGRGRRMGRLKQVLPWAGSTVVAAAFDALARHCGAGMVLVLGDEADRVIDALGQRTFWPVESDSDSEQLHSARLGLRRAVEIPVVRRVLLHPADHPVIPPLVIEALLRRTSECDRALIPTYRGRGGHPVLIPACIAQDIITWEPGESRPAACLTAGGLRVYFKSHPGQVERLEFRDAADLVMDLDSPDDYAQAHERHE